MRTIDAYRRHLRREEDWRRFMLQNSGSPDHCMNRELALAVAEEGDRVLFGTLTSVNNVVAAGTPEEFLIICGVVGLGRLIAEGDETLIPTLRTFANGDSGRLRDAAGLAIELIAERNPPLLVRIRDAWADERDQPGLKLVQSALATTRALRSIGS